MDGTEVLLDSGCRRKAGPCAVPRWHHSAAPVSFTDVLPNATSFASLRERARKKYFGDFTETLDTTTAHQQGTPNSPSVELTQPLTRGIDPSIGKPKV